MNLAEELSNVSKACRIMVLSRDTFYRYKDAVEEGGSKALIGQNRRQPNIKNRVDEITESAAVAYATDYPAHGQVLASNELRKKGQSVDNLLTSLSTIKYNQLNHQLIVLKSSMIKIIAWRAIIRR